VLTIANRSQVQERHHRQRWCRDFRPTEFSVLVFAETIRKSRGWDMRHFKFQIPSRDNSTSGCSFRVLTGLVGAGRRAKGGSGGLAPEVAALVTTLVATRERWSNRRDAMVVLEKGKQATNVVLNSSGWRSWSVEQVPVGLTALTGRHFVHSPISFQYIENACGRTWNRWVVLVHSRIMLQSIYRITMGLWETTGIDAETPTVSIHIIVQ
jgi:hypothetical protein